jgi:hypothetical protein
MVIKVVNPKLLQKPKQRVIITNTNKLIPSVVYFAPSGYFPKVPNILKYPYANVFSIFSCENISSFSALLLLACIYHACVKIIKHSMFGSNYWV